MVSQSLPGRATGLINKGTNAWRNLRGLVPKIVLFSFRLLLIVTFLAQFLPLDLPDTQPDTQMAAMQTESATQTGLLRHESLFDFLRRIAPRPFGPTLALAHSSGITLTKSVPVTVYTDNPVFTYTVNIQNPNALTIGQLAVVSDTVIAGQNLQGGSATSPWWYQQSGGHPTFKLIDSDDSRPDIVAGSTALQLAIPIADHTILTHTVLCFKGTVAGNPQEFCELVPAVTTEVRAPAFGFSQVPTATCAGSAITYTLAISNYGGAATTKPFTLETQLDPTVEYVVGSASDGGIYSAGRITWPVYNILLANGANEILRSFQVTVPAWLDDGDLITHVYTVTSPEVTPDGGGIWSTQIQKVSAEFTHTAPVCWGETVYFTNTAGSIPATEWAWDFGDGTPIVSGVNSVSHQYANPGIYEASLVVTGVCGSVLQTDVYTALVAVEDVIASFQAAPTQVCAGGTVWFTNTSLLSGTVDAWLWDFGDGTSDTTNWLTTNHSYNTPGEYVATLYVTNTLGCSDWATQTISVEAVTASFEASPTQVCAGGTVWFTNTSLLSGTVSAWLWDFGDGISDATNWATTNHLYSTPGEYVATLYVTNTLGCSDWATQTISVEAVTASFEAAPTQVCAGGTVWFTNTSLLSGTVDAWLWDFGDGTSDATNWLTTNHSYNTPGEYVATLYVTTTAGCYDSEAVTITVQGIQASFDSAPGSLCVNGTVYLTSTSTLSGTVEMYTWNYGDGVIESGEALSTTSHLYTLPGEHVVTLYVTNTLGCSDWATKTVSVQDLTVDFSADSSACLGDGVAFTNLTVVTPTNSISSYLWDFGNGDVITNVWAGFLYMGYTSSGLYTATLTVTTTAGCVNSTSRQVTIHPTPQPTFTVNSPVCVGDTMYFANSTSGGDNTYLWEFGDSTISSLENPSHTYGVAGTYTVTLTVTNTQGCAASLQQQVNVLSLPVTSFTWDTPVCASEVMTFMNTTPPPIHSLLWDFGDGEISYLMNPTHTFTSAGTYPVTLTVTNTAGCVSSVSNMVTVTALPVAAFTSSSPVCLGEVMSFTNQSTGASSYLWDFGDDTISIEDNPSYSYLNSGNYTVTLIAISECGMSVTQTQVTVYALPQPAIQREPAGTVNVSESVTFTDTGSGAVSWSWDFGDGYADEGQVVEHTYESQGIYTVTLIVTNSVGCANRATDIIEVREPYDASVYLPAVFKGYGPQVNLVIDSIQWMIGNELRSSPPPNPGQPFHVQVVVRNTGPDTASPGTEGIWVDLYLKPSRTPTVGDLWWNLSQSGACPTGNDCYGFAWHITNPLPAGGTVTLSTTAPVDPNFSRWPVGGVPYSPSKHVPIVAFVDVWPVPVGDVAETNENDNLSSWLSGTETGEIRLNPPVRGEQATGGRRPRMSHAK